MQNGHTPVYAAFDALDNLPRQIIYRPAQPLTYELTNHSKAYLEAKSYASGFTFLNALLSSGTSVSFPAKPYLAYLAPASHLALASTLIVYPFVTTKSKLPDAIKGSDAALRYLRSVLATVPPLDDTLRKAFRFPDERTRRRTLDARNRSRSPSTHDGREHERLELAAANAQSLWYRAADFWHIVGWAFNCSIEHEKLWERWKLWLELKLDYLEREWDERVKWSKEEDVDKQKILMDSLIWHYLSSEDPSQRNNRRRVLKAIFAMAGAQALSTFPEVWKVETEEQKPVDENGHITEDIDIENDVFGTIMNDDDDIEMGDTSSIYTGAGASTSKPDEKNLKTEQYRPIEDDRAAIARLGGSEAIDLRQRLLSLLVQVADHLPTQFTKTEDFYDNVTEEINTYPTYIFSTIVSTFHLQPLSRMALNSNLILPMTTTQLPNYSIPDLLPNQTHLEVNLLPCRANTQSFATNAKISLVLEEMFMYMMNMKVLEATRSLRKSMEDGIQARQRVHGTGRGKKGNAKEEEQARGLLEQSSERLHGLLEVVEIAAGKQSQPRRKRVKSMSPVFTSSISSAMTLSSPERSDTEEDD
ncbi:hypothetical protein P154DRAFT_431876 [Amniculicola lignicola CBS 123094]|uniref:Uncharacterized protein n=1 Tax=Amniculicola lignicola CBS 123094 TaxID=1392246 RepID=A0A6A5WNS6_9PLEO|nr:hypothetical protein P154DRAFT_431876 [Amniculicola lignicola CBS 123094]